MGITGLPFTLRRGSLEDLAVISQLGDEAKQWLRGKNTDQWAKPWPDSGKQDERLLKDLANGRTWVAWDGTTAVATVTITSDDPRDPAGKPVWPEHKLAESALYVHRVIVRRSYAGLGLGAGLLDWAADVAMREIGTPRIRIDVWTDNWDLHAYYRRQGFRLCEYRDPRAVDYPSRALFERCVEPNGRDGYRVLFREQQAPGPG